MKTRAGTFFVALLLAAGCGSSSSNKDGGGSPGTGPYLPLAVGNRWTYQISDVVDGTVSVKVQSVTANEPVGGVGDSTRITAYKIVTGNRFADPDGDVSYQGLTDDSRYVRYRELSIDGKDGHTKKEEYYDSPWKIRLDVSADHMKAGMTWIESYTERFIDYLKANPDGGVNDAGMDLSDGGIETGMMQVTANWEVVGVDQEITLPIGTFKALVVKRVSMATSKTFWYVKGVGKVKETGVGEQTEVLSDYEVKP